jgi:hypothetical protein
VRGPHRPPRKPKKAAEAEADGDDGATPSEQTSDKATGGPSSRRKRIRRPSASSKAVKQGVAASAASSSSRMKFVEEPTAGEVQDAAMAAVAAATQMAATELAAIGQPRFITRSTATARRMVIPHDDKENELPALSAALSPAPRLVSAGEGEPTSMGCRLSHLDVLKAAAQASAHAEPLPHRAKPASRHPKVDAAA